MSAIRGNTILGEPSAIRIPSTIRMNRTPEGVRWHNTGEQSETVEPQEPTVNGHNNLTIVHPSSPGGITLTGISTHIKFSNFHLYGLCDGSLRKRLKTVWYVWKWLKAKR